jgi:hypothetical protein
MQKASGVRKNTNSPSVLLEDPHVEEASFSDSSVFKLLKGSFTRLLSRESRCSSAAAAATAQE